MSGGGARPIRVWDAPTRLFHWLLVVLIAVAWLTYRAHQLELHKLVGYAVIALLIFRIVWGVLGSETARFSSFLKGPRGAWLYLRGRAGPQVGHNPLGGWSIVAMLAVLAALAVCGLFAMDQLGLDPGPLASAVSFEQARLATRLHGVLFNVLLGFVGLHLVAVLTYLAAGRNLIGPMITGRAKVSAGVAEPRAGPWWALVVGLALAGAAAWGLWRLDA